ncbi:MAG: hypothetical protein LAO24_09790 [Acidobacteriia bacterium]|nr:hypothetical protein [Terriglobia bacterium]
MRKTMAVWTVAILGFMIGWGAAGLAQEGAQAKPTPEAKTTAQGKAEAAATTEKPVHAYRLDFSVNELEDGKKINTRQYSLNLNADDANEIKIGTRVPVESGHEQFQYMDVGTSIWCRIGERPDGVALAVRADISNFAIPDQGTHESRPVVRQFKINASTLALLGRPMVVGSVDDPNSKRQFQLEVTVNRLR